MNLIINTDSYKLTHKNQYPQGTITVNSYIESRGGSFDKTVFFGLQAFIKEYLIDNFITKNDIDEAEKLISEHFGRNDIFNRKDWEEILKLGYYPITIEAVKEGTVLPTKNVLLQIRNTMDEFWWLPSFMETAILRAIWYPTTVATYSYHCKEVLKKYYERTVCDD